MFELKRIKKYMAAASTLLLSSVALNGHAATATYDSATGVVHLPVVEVVGGTSSEFFNVTLQLNPEGTELTLVTADSIASVTGQRNVYDADTTALHISSVLDGSTDLYAKLVLVPGSDPMRFTLNQVVNNAFEGCPSFSTPGPTNGSCVLSGTLTNDVVLTKNIQWILSGGVYVGGGNTQNATLTVNPGTQIFGESGADYLYIRRGSKIMAEGTPDNPIVMTGPLQQAPGEWGGLLIAGNAPINGCNEGVPLCEAPFEAITSEFFGGNNPTDNSGVVKYTQILFAGFAVRPDEELNGLTLMGVGSGTKIDYVQVHSGLDDGVEMFGGTVQMKHLGLTDNRDDAFDWTSGYKGRVQFVLIKQSPGIGDRGIEADNNEKNHDSSPRAHPVLSNVTIIGRNDTGATQGILLRRGTAGNIWNSVITGSPVCLRIDSEATYLNAGAPGSLTGELTIQNSFAHCDSNFADGDGATFAVADWFTSQSGNSQADPQLNGFFPASGSPLTTSGVAVNDSFFTPVNHVGAFRDANDDWTREWTFPFN